MPLDAYVPVTNSKAGVAGWPVGVRHFLYDRTQFTCAQAESAFRALSLAQKISQTVPAVPSAINGPWQDRGCSAATPETPSLVEVCSLTSEQKSGNSQEIASYTLTLPAAAVYTLIITYASKERAVTGTIRINAGSPQALALDYSLAFTTRSLAGIALNAGSNTIQLSTGAAGGFLQFSKVCTRVDSALIESDVITNWQNT